MLAISFNSVLIIAVIAVLAPVLLGLLPGLPVPGAVVEVIAGVVVGPSVLGWVRIDAPVQVLSDLGLGILLFLAGLEIDIERLRGPLVRLAGSAFALSVVLALLCAYVFWLAGEPTQPLLLATILMSTSAGLLLPMLKDADEDATKFGQLVMTAAALAEIVPIMLVSLFFSAASKTTEAQLVSLAIFLLLLGLIGLALSRVRRLETLDRLFDRLSDQSAQLRVRAALTLALACGVLAYRFGFASILGAFAAGLLVRLIEISGRTPHPQFQIKLEGIGFGFLIPIFFITTGVGYPLRALLARSGRDRRGAAVPGRPASGTGGACAAVPAYGRHPPRRGRGLAAGHHAHVRDRGDADRARHRKDDADRGRVAAGRRAVVGRPVPGHRVAAPVA